MLEDSILFILIYGIILAILPTTIQSILFSKRMIFNTGVVSTCIIIMGITLIRKWRTLEGFQLGGECGASKVVCSGDKPLCINGVCSEYVSQPFPSIPNVTLTDLEKYHLQPIIDNCAFEPRCQASAQNAVTIYQKYNTDLAAQKLGVRYIRVRPSQFNLGDGFLNISQIAVYEAPTVDSTGALKPGQNIALRKTVTSNTTTDTAGGPLSNITDGTMDGRTTNTKGAWKSATNNYQNDYIEIDLGSDRYPYNLILYGNPDSSTGCNFTTNSVVTLRIQALNSSRAVVLDFFTLRTTTMQNMRFISVATQYETDFTKFGLTDAQTVDAYKEIYKSNLLNDQYNGCKTASDVIKGLEPFERITKQSELITVGDIGDRQRQIWRCIQTIGIGKFTAILMDATKPKKGDTTPSAQAQNWNNQTILSALPAPVVPTTAPSRGPAIVVSRLDDGSTNDALARARGSGFMTIPRTDLDPGKILGDTSPDPFGANPSKSGIYASAPPSGGYTRPNSIQGCPTGTRSRVCSDPSGKSTPNVVCLPDNMSCEYECVDANGTPTGTQPISCSGVAVTQTCPANSSYATGSRGAGCYSSCPSNTQAIGDKCYACPFGTEYAPGGYGLDKYKGKCVFKCNGAAMDFQLDATVTSATSYDIICKKACPAFMIPLSSDSCITQCPTGFEDIGIDTTSLPPTVGQTVFMGSDNAQTVDGKVNGCWAALDLSVAESPYVTIRPPIRFNNCPAGYQYYRGLSFSIKSDISSITNLGMIQRQAVVAGTPEVFNSVFNIIRSPGGYSVDQFLSDVKAPATDDMFRSRTMLAWGFNNNMAGALNPKAGCFRFDSGDVTTGGGKFNLPYKRVDLLFSGTTHVIAKVPRLLGLAGLSDTNPAHLIHQSYYNSITGAYADESTNPANIMKNFKVVVCPVNTYPVIPTRVGEPMYCSSEKPTSTIDVDKLTYPILSFKKSDILGTKPYLYQQFNKIINDNPPSKQIKVSNSSSLRSPLALIDFPTYSTGIYGDNIDLFSKPVSWALAYPKYRGGKGDWTTTTDIFNSIVGATNAAIGNAAAEAVINHMLSQGWNYEMAVLPASLGSAAAQISSAGSLNQFQKDMLLLYRSFPKGGFSTPTKAITQRTYVGPSIASAVKAQTMMCIKSCPDYGCPPNDGTVPTECAPDSNGISATRCIAPGTMC